MRDLIIEATIDALKSVKHPRFFRTERGYHGRFYCALQSVLDQRMSLDDACILEMEYRKAADTEQVSVRILFCISQRGKLDPQLKRITMRSGHLSANRALTEQSMISGSWMKCSSYFATHWGFSSTSGPTNIC